MHRNCLALALMTCLAIPGLASAATAKKGTTKTELPDCSAVTFDGSNLTEEENDYFFSNQNYISTTQILRFALGRDSILADFYARRKGTDFNANVMKIKDLAKQKGLASQMTHDLTVAENAQIEQNKNHKWTKDTGNTLFCRIDAIGDTATNSYNTYAASYLKGLQAKHEAMHGQVGYFDVTVNDCTLSKSIDTGNRYSAVKPDPDARFLTVNATFKNTNNESRLPLEGSLVISKDDKDFKFDTAETIMSDGYGIRMRSLNPLIKLNTKIVYKVPNELSGEVYWKPGRNAEDKKLWCTYLPSA
ncbi:hypothetical protein [Pseudomonas viridiflava]|uniref:hypothetical protein n=1 Tax=Pseudomonas viridiflava TaxID=33069 RepID=UPI000F042465|nr:hypothetical protein [Pseudomonas viridiflava]MBI6576962.1 hypothetical protein [Pseudomonas viridiflava]MBI6607489.1 hypothetical protein [Pseudomonas viridiflava]MBI6638851.1 hypothetical protein [Pseudomonas viridiflava]MBI6869533.1 hypothetical protein [Pseudomonas viridiflava]MEE4133527.1 hypothetical protein [Pseudomonas viridiflava]